MIRRLTPWVVLACFLLVPGVACAQARAADGSDDGVVGPWLSDKAWEGLMNKFADNVSEHFSLDENQRALTRDVFQTRIRTWLQDNRQEIVPLVNTYVESILSDEPPSPEMVADWARMVIPLKDQFVELTGMVADDMGQFMTDEQHARMKGELAAFHYGMDVVGERLNRWSDGGWDWQSEWPGSPTFKAEQQRRDREVQEGMTAVREETLQQALGDRERIQRNYQTAQPSNDPWARYVENFIKLYELDEAQERKAREYLAYQTQNRDRYLDREKASIDELEVRIATAKTDEEKAKYVELYEQKAVAVDNMYKVLKQRLEKLPTRAQRRAAELKQPKTKPADQ